MFFALLQTYKRRPTLQGAARQQGAVLSVDGEVPLSQPAGGALQNQLNLQTEPDIPQRSTSTGRTQV